MRSIARALLAATLAVAAGVAGVAGLPSASAADLDELRTRAQEVADRLSALERRLVDLEAERERLEGEIASANRDIAALELHLHRSERSYRTARARYVGSAVEAYKEGTTSHLAVLLSARSIAELASLARAAEEAARIDSEALEQYLAASQAAESGQEAVDERKQELLADQARVAAVAADISAATEERSRVLDHLKARIATLEAEARRRAILAQQRAAEKALAGLLEPDNSGAGPADHLPPGFVATGVTFEGAASWYGPGFVGDVTANGEIFDPDKYTAASKELPFNTWLFVEHEGLGVIVRINDRGPYVGRRILDLSRAAAEAIGLSGVGWVEVEILLKS